MSSRSESRALHVISTFHTKQQTCTESCKACRDNLNYPSKAYRYSTYMHQNAPKQKALTLLQYRNNWYNFTNRRLPQNSMTSAPLPRTQGVAPLLLLFAALSRRALVVITLLRRVDVFLVLLLLLTQFALIVLLDQPVVCRGQRVQ